jgi:class 3 adenylate cyclase/tetratricopeptide (TPR) repeat protein
MSTTPDEWPSFLPWYVLRDLAQNPQAAVGLPLHFETVALFADISGFTAMSEALAASGRVGAEELTRVLNRYFLPMIDLVHSYGGTIAKFGGDAMTVLFPTPSPALPHPLDGGGSAPSPTNEFLLGEGWGGGREGVARRALQCAIEMQARMPQYAAISTSAGTFGLAMKAGLAVGPVLTLLAGDPAVRLEHIVAGEVLDRCTDAEHHAAPGQVIAHRDVLVMAGEETTSEEAFLPVQRLRPRPHPLALPLPGDLSAVPEKIGWAFIHPSIAERLRRGQASFINEHRRVTVLFVGFAGFDYDGDPDVSTRLQAYLDGAFRCVVRFGGYVNKVDMGDKGSKMVILFGAPIAQEDDVSAALRCALELAKLPGANTSIGVNTGFVFCGQVGSLARREYTVMGDAVNLAARLMQKASAGQILVGEATRQSAKKYFEWGEAMPTPVKGKHEPVMVSPLLGERLGETLRLQEPHYTLPMVGRQAELEQARQLLERTRQGQGQVVGLTAEAGMGKSRLAAEIIRLAGELGLRAYGGECLSHAAQSSYLVWKPVLRSLFGLEEGQPIEVQITQLRASLAAMNHALLSRLPLLGQPLDLPISENETTRSMDAQLRKAAFEDLVSAFVCHTARRQPLLLVLEDCHWMDPLSADLLETVGRDLATEKITLLAVYRPPDENRAPLAVTRLAHFHEICLSEFDLAETEQLIRQKLAQFGFGAEQVSAQLVTRINARAQGNPFFVDEMVNWLHDRGISPTDAAALEKLSLPDSLYSLIISRIDQLEESARTTLKVASVLGRSFRANWLWGIFPEVGAPERVRSQLTQLAELEFTPLDRPDPELEYLFKHIVTREVAYESLAVSTRQMLHEQAGQFIEQTYPHDLERFVDLLAYHYGQSSNTIKQIEYFDKAAQSAQKAYANTVAVDYCRHLLPLLSGSAKNDLLLRLGTLQLTTGEWEQAENGAHQAMAWMAKTSQTANMAAGQMLLGAIARHRGDFPAALKWLRKAQRSFTAAHDDANLLNILREIGIIHWSQAQYPAALRYFRRCKKLAETRQDSHSLAQVLGNIGLVYMNQDENVKALRTMQRGLALAEKDGNRALMCTLVGNIGTAYQGMGDFGRAMTYFTRYLMLSQEIGFRLGVSIAVGNMGMVYLDSGSPDLALPCFMLSQQMAAKMGDQLGVAFAQWGQALAQQALGHLPEAEKLLNDAIALGQSLDIPYELSDFYTNLATLYVEMSRWDDAHAANQRALETARSAERQPLEMQAQLLAPWLELQSRKITPPQAAGVLSALETALDTSDEMQPAAWHFALWQVTGDESHRQQAAERYQALYARTPNVLFRQRYNQLTGKDLPPAPALPPLPEIVTSAFARKEKPTHY